MTYLAIAYRWGDTNNHWYVVYVGDDEGKAVALAENTRDGRGGKYGVAIYEVTDSGEDLELHSYYACRDELEPSLNWRIEMFEHLGHTLHDYVSNLFSVPDPENPNHLKRIDVEPVPLLSEAVARATERYKMLGELSAKASEERRARRGIVFCPYCDSATVYSVEYRSLFWKHPRENPDECRAGGAFEVEDLRGNWCTTCEQLHITQEQLGGNLFRIKMTRNALGE